MNESERERIYQTAVKQMATELGVLTCHRCRKAITDSADVVQPPIRITIRQGQSFQVRLLRFKQYHRKCLPPVEFHKLSAENTDECGGTGNGARADRPRFGVTQPFTIPVEIS